MLFNSEIFIALFLPISLLLFFIFGANSPNKAIASLIVLSSIFYAWHNPFYLIIIIVSIIGNYLFAIKISGCVDPLKRKSVFVMCVIVNVLVLVYYKYTNFIFENLNYFGFGFDIPNIILPLAISFFTFQQISFVADIYKCNAALPSFSDYSAFVLFFPQLIAGPIITYNDFFPQIKNEKVFCPHSANLAVGFTIFILGLYKKTIFADGAAFIADPIFNAAETQLSVSFFQGWIGVFAFSFQIYFDFSGYSDMAVGLARLFNIQFPANFNSPYKSENMIEFWRRWHISLSRFLRDYIYIPFGGNRNGPTRRMMNLMATMLIGGLWHGASWTFIIWGALHGSYLVVNHFVQAKFSRPTQIPIFRFFKRIFVFYLVSVTWVFFRSETFGGAFRILKGLFCLDGVMQLPIQARKFMGHIVEALGLNQAVLFDLPASGYRDSCILIFCMFLIVFFMPNVLEWTSRYKSALDFAPYYTKSRWSRYLYWRPTLYHLAIMFVILTVAFSNLGHKKEFIYFQF